MSSGLFKMLPALYSYMNHIYKNQPTFIAITLRSTLTQIGSTC